jgi:plastocyanin domain-containing protein
MIRSIASVSFAALFALTACSKPAAAPPAPGPQAANRFNVMVDADGYHPSTVSVHAGQPTTIVFTRTTDEGCGQQVVFPTLNVRRDLPLNQPVEVQVTPTAAAPIAFTCGMGMMRGTIVAAQ